MRYLSLEYREPKPPKGRPVGKMGIFYSQPFRIQCFIYCKYTLNWPKKWIQKYLFIVGEGTYYRYDHRAKEIMKEIFGESYHLRDYHMERRLKGKDEKE